MAIPCLIRLIVRIADIAAAMDHGNDGCDLLIVIYLVNDSVALVDQLADIVAIGFWHVSSHARELRQTFGPFDETFGELAGVER